MSLDAAVITVPAYFSTVQSEATKGAGTLAGFKQIVLLQEPIAAAIAYGFLNQKNENWLVYDLRRRHFRCRSRRTHATDLLQC